MTSRWRIPRRVRAKVGWPQRSYRLLIAVEALTGGAALAGGIALAVAPDGSLLRADQQSLAASPFHDWRWPGVLLASLVGGGYLLTALLTFLRWPYLRQLTMFAGAGLVAFELAEVGWLGPRPLQAVFAGVGAFLFVAAVRSPGRAGLLSTSAGRAPGRRRPARTP